MLKLGGDVGSVYRAEDTKIRRQVAIKVLHNEFIHVPNGCYPSTVI